MNQQDIKNFLINPYYAINISPLLVAEHEAMTTKEKWIAANITLIDEIGSEEWLKRLLDILESGKK
ncbi:MAG: hypothetical protein WC107_02125 [Patescibacteria group bacterium]